jgi:hypothetical protein
MPATDGRFAKFCIGKKGKYRICLTKNLKNSILEAFVISTDFVHTVLAFVIACILLLT